MPSLLRSALFVWSSGVLAATAVASCGDPPIELCFVVGDEDENGLPDCADPTCWRPNGACEEVCAGTDDEDGDGDVGCEDSFCWTPDTGCAELCDSAIATDDEDGDNAAGCADSDCWVEGGACPEQCGGGGNDEDVDGAADCADSDCFLPENGCPELCGSALDEDGDGAIDCDDSDCAAELICAPTYSRDIRPILMNRCGQSNCHSAAAASGALNVEIYDDLPKSALFCDGLTKGACALVRIKEGSMPKNCFGCVPQSEIDLIQQWVDAGLPK
ncbi:MAG: hypothetical protein EXR75_05695 [Myxococcales bacterium]|nr:hypothetical protein [Myxococcales bacterium]